MGDVLSFLGSVDAGGVATPQAVAAATPLPVTGGAAGFPVSAVVNSPALTFPNGSTNPLQANVHGALAQVPQLSTGQAVTEFLAGADNRANAALGYLAYSFPSIFNGGTWDRATKPRTAFRIPASAGTNNAASILGRPGTIYSISALITASAPTGVYLKFFDVVGVPNPAATVPLYVFGLTYNTGPVGTPNINLPPQGLYFPTGIGVAVVGGAADLDNTAIAVGQLLSLNVTFGG